MQPRDFQLRQGQVASMDIPDRLRFGALAFAAFVLSTLIIGWLTNPFPR